MSGQPGFFDTDERLRALSAAGDPLERLAAVVDFELFRPELEAALARGDRSRGGRPPYDAVLMFRVLVLQALYTLSDDQTEYQLRDRLSFMRFVGLGLHEPVPDAKTIWLYREQLTRAGALARAFERCDTALRAWCTRRHGLPRHGGSDCGCHCGRGTQATVEQRREAGRARGQHPRRLVQGAHPADGPRWAMDHPARAQEDTAAWARAARDGRDRHAPVRLQKPSWHRPRTRLHPPVHRDPRRPARRQPTRRGAGCK